MTKEEILNNHLDVDGVWWRDETTNGQVFAAMDEYAKQECIGFKKFIEDRFLDIRYNINHEGDDVYIHKITFVAPPKRHTIENVYELYLESKNKK